MSPDVREPLSSVVLCFWICAGTKRVHNNIVYNEYISHREHVHMNSTQWETLTDFTKWLGREGDVTHTHTQNSTINTCPPVLAEEFR